MSARRRLYLVSYDITEPRRLNRVARLLLDHGWRVQYSVFLGEWTATGRDRLLERLEDLIERREDDLRCYPLPRAGRVALVGEQIFPRDLLLLRHGHNVLRLRTAVPAGACDR